MGEDGAPQARLDLPYLFKAFETGQINPKRMDKLYGGERRVATIHEYLDWTVTAQAAEEDGDLDFSGFRLLVLLNREKPAWPPPGMLDTEEPRAAPNLGAPGNPLPKLLVKGRSLSAATIRLGPGYLEIPFVATHEAKRGRGYGRCILEAIEDIARACGVPLLLLCSTNDDKVKSTWLHLGFRYTSEADMEQFGVLHSDLIHMENTVQMHKDVPPPRPWRSVVIKHKSFVTRTYAALGAEPARSRPYQNGRCRQANSVDGSSSD